MATRPAAHVPIGFGDLTRLLDKQAERGVQIHQHDFRDSPHVEHLRWHPAQYSAVLDDFMRGLLRSDISQQSDSREKVDASAALTETMLQ